MQPGDQVTEALILEVIAEPIETVVVAAFDGVGDSEIGPSRSRRWSTLISP